MKKIRLLLVVIMIMLPVFIFSAKVVVRVPQDPDFLDPHKAAASGTEEMMFNVFEGLLKADSNGNVVPAVAERYSVSPDGLVYTFKLRKGIKFHNGALVTVDDIIYSLDSLRGANNEKPLSSTFSSFIKDVKATDKETVVVSMKELNTSFITNFTVAIIPKNNVDPNKNPIGTGPFKFKEYLPGQRVVIQKFSDYWKKGVPTIDEVEFRIITDDQAALLALLSGEIDMSPRIDVLQLDLLSDNFQVIKSEQNMVQLLALNHQNKYFSDVRVRQAINYAVDKDEIIDAVALGYGTKLGSNMSPVMKKYYRQGLENYYQKDIAKAKELLRQAGYPNGFRTTITVPSNYKFHVDTA
ncbi:MAG TPA: ABC transporter substrate-binding protein, partial [Petrotogaceae bacterium]|nr:ABC transporter substrate-binding protein [Petrotogaceae bacterium]